MDCSEPSVAKTMLCSWRAHLHHRLLFDNYIAWIYIISIQHRVCRNWNSKQCFYLIFRFLLWKKRQWGCDAFKLKRRGSAFRRNHRKGIIEMFSFRGGLYGGARKRGHLSCKWYCFFGPWAFLLCLSSSKNFGCRLWNIHCCDRQWLPNLATDISFCLREVKIRHPLQGNSTRARALCQFKLRRTGLSIDIFIDRPASGLELHLVWNSPCKYNWTKSLSTKLLWERLGDEALHGEISSPSGTTSTSAQRLPYTAVYLSYDIPAHRLKLKLQFP